jgi:Rieske Fe-S protein
MVDAPQSFPRRRWLLYSLRTAIASTLVAIFYPVIWFLRPRRSTVSGALEVVAPFTVKDLPNVAGNPFDFAGKPCLVILTPEGIERLAAGEPLRAGEDVKAFNALCTHVDCTVRYRVDREDIFCSCHEGIYDLSGRNISGPPPRPLESYKVTLRGERGQEEIVISRQPAEESVS